MQLQWRNNVSKWHHRFLDLAYTVASWSKDPEQQVGCVLVSPCRRHFAVGYNGFAQGIEDSDSRLNTKEVKNSIIIHAEQNAVYNADCVRGWTAYVTKAPCVTCANAFIQSGIAKVVTKQPKASSDWFDHQVTAINLMLEAGLEIAYI